VGREKSVDGDDGYLAVIEVGQRAQLAEHDRTE
jgi:hypothetical protein